MNKQHAVKATLSALTLGAALGLVGCGGSDDAGGMGGMDHNSASPQMSQPPSSPSPSSASPSPSSASSSSITAAQFNDDDVMFVQRMLPHHVQAVEMSDALLKKSGISAPTMALAKQINAAQQPEITTMEGWLKSWGQPTEGGTGGMDHGGMDHGGMGDDGMATDAEMKKFDQATGATAEKMYLEMMTRHHQGAITMAQAEAKNGENADAIQLAKDIATSQQAEITAMKKLLANL